MKYKNIEKGKIYEMKSLDDILKIEGVSLRQEGLFYKKEYMSIGVMENMYGKEVRVMAMLGKKNALNIGIDLADSKHSHTYMQEIPSKFLKKLDKDSD